MSKLHCNGPIEGSGEVAGLTEPADVARIAVEGLGEEGPAIADGAGLHALRADDDRPSVSVVVPTKHREGMLPALIARLFSQTGCGSIGLEVVVVDNSSDQSARPVIDELRRTHGDNLRYLWEERPGVSHVRNTGVRAARGSLIGFIDDDEIPCQDWLASMLASRTRYAADVVLGPVYPNFEVQDVARDPFFRNAFTQSSERPTGTIVEPKSPLRAIFRPASCYRTMATNNALVERRHLGEDAPAFEPKLTHLGGEDLLFFHNLYLKGKKFVWCREAAVFEHIPAERSEIHYLLTRRFRDGQITSVTCVLSKPRQYLRLLVSMAVGCFQFVVGSGLALVFVLTGSRRARIAVSLLAAGAGKLLWMPRFHHRSYGLTEGGAKP